MPRKTKEEAEKTRAAILKAAELVFYQQGVVSTSLQDVAKAAGVTRGAVYWHFRDKVDLLRDLADDVFLPSEELLERLVAVDHGDPLGALRTECCMTLNALANDPRRRRLLTILTQRCEYIEEMGPMVQRNNACRDRMRERLTSMFEQARRKKQLAAGWTPQSAALALQHMILGFVYAEMDYARPSRARDAARTGALTAFFTALEG